MSKTKSFDGVTPNVWDCIKETSYKEHGTKYEPANANQGTATTDSVVGKVILKFDIDPSKNILTYTIDKKPFLVSEGQIWNGIEKSIRNCQS